MWNKLSKVMCIAVLLTIAAIPAGAANYYTVGNKGSDVLLIQKQLRKLGYKVKMDGVYSKDMPKAVAKFQADKKIQVSGNVGGWTYYLLTGQRTMLTKNTTKAINKSIGSKNAKNNLANPLTTSQVKYTKLKNLTGTDRVGSQLVSSAYKYLGVPYVFGGNTPDGFDCSGFTQFVYKNFGVSLSRTAAEQYKNGTAVTNLQAGDLVMFGKSGINHVGIYIGGNTFIHAANSSRGVTTDTLASGYYKINYVGARRIF